MTNRPGRPTLAGADWLTRDATQAVLRALAAGGHEARIVGGAVRNALMGRPVKDIDIATTAEPETTMRLATAAGLAAHPTGLRHGTVTVVSGHVPHEVTTLRRDAETFGRHARVEFTADWAEDASRRDFTINALYCASDGTVHDPLGSGLADVAAKRVRFIGDPHARIREDYLRILRFFRFSAEYTGGTLDAAGLTACREERAGIAQLSAERIHAEMLRLLTAPAATGVVPAMATAGVAEAALALAPDVTLFERFVALEAAAERAPDALMRLSVLAGGTRAAADHLIRHLKLSNAEGLRLRNATASDAASHPAAGTHAARIAIYRRGNDAFRDGVLIGWARSGRGADDGAYLEHLGIADTWTAPELPVRGADLIARGIPPGPAIGRIVSGFEAWWLAEGFPADPALVETRLAALIRAETDATPPASR